jgi:hypothetical protein
MFSRSSFGELTMRAILAGLLLLFLTANWGLGQDAPKKSVAIKADFSFYEDNWGLRVKTFSLDLVQVKTKTGDPIVIGRITYLLEFDKDVINQDLESIQAIFVDKGRRVRHIFLDQDHIAINPFVVLPYRIQGEISGVRGEAFRIIVDMEFDAEAIILPAKKLVVRP